MKKYKYFTYAEITASSKAKELNIANVPTQEEAEKLHDLLEILDRMRESLGFPIRITSGYRCTHLNMIVGGATGSQHTKGEAVDLSGKDKNQNRLIYQWLLDNGQYDQLINERNFSWIHWSYKKGGVNRTRSFSLK